LRAGAVTEPTRTGIQAKPMEENMKWLIVMLAFCAFYAVGEVRPQGAPFDRVFLKK
jgi:hypothetical protein